MVDSEIKIRVHLEIDPNDKSKIENEASAIKQTGNAPIQLDGEEQGFGIFAGDRIDPGVKGFEKSQKSFRTPFKDTTSKAPIQRTKSFDDLANRIDKIEETVSSAEELQKLIGFDPTEFKNLLNIARNPAGFLLQFVNTIGLPLAVVTTIISSPRLVEELVNFLTQRGGLFDRYFKRKLQEEQNPFLSRQEQKLRQIGEQGVIFTQYQRFGTTDGNLVTNSLAQARANGISDIGLRDRAGGLY